MSHFDYTEGALCHLLALKNHTSSEELYPGNKYFSKKHINANGYSVGLSAGYIEDIDRKKYVFDHYPEPVKKAMAVLIDAVVKSFFSILQTLPEQYKSANEHIGLKFDDELMVFRMVGVNPLLVQKEFLWDLLLKVPAEQKNDIVQRLNQIPEEDIQRVQEKVDKINNEHTPIVYFTVKKNNMLYVDLPEIGNPYEDITY
jgi:hypothetical protein